MAEEITAFDTQITAIPEAAAAGLTDYKSFLSFRGDYLNGIRNTDGQADMDVEALLYRVYGGTNWYRIEALADTLETYDTQEDHRALIVSNRQQLGPAGGHGPAGGGAGKLGYDPFPAAVLCEILYSGVRQGSGGMVRTQHRAPALPHPGCGTGCGTPGPCSGPSRRGRSVLNVQRELPALCAGAGGGEYNSLCHSVPGPGAPAICRLRPGRHLGVGHSLVRLDLRHLSAGAGGADFGPVPGGRRLTAFLSQYSGNYIAMLLKAVPLFVAVGAVLGSWLLDLALTFRPSGTATALGCPRVRRRWPAPVLLALGLGLCA